VEDRLWAWRGDSKGHLRLRIAGGRVDVHAQVERPGQDLVILHEPDAGAPRPGSLELRSSGLWVDAVEEEPGERWTIGVEAFALAVDDPADTVGTRVPLGFDLEWERTGPDGPDGVPARVHGEVLVGDDALDLDAGGHWHHR
jgi:hypothetical protein